MKKSAMIVAVAGLASALQAAPLESITFTNVPSIGRQGNALNEIRTWTPTATGNVAKITVSGNLLRNTVANITNTWSSQAMILVTPPGGGAQFIIQPFTGTANMAAAGGSNVAAGAFTVPVGPAIAANTGEWSFRFFEASWEGLAASVADASWTTLTLTMDDEAVALQDLPVFVPSTIEYTFNNVTCDVPWNAPVDTHNFVAFTPTSSNVVDTVVVSGIATGTSLEGAANTFNINVGNATYNITPTRSMLIRVKPPVHPTLGGGFRTARYAVNPIGAASSTSLQWSPVAIAGVDTTVEPVGSTNPAIPANTGEWKVEFLSNLSSATTAAFKSTWNTVRVNLVQGAAPASAELVTLVHGSTVTKTGTFAAVGETKWYKFTVGTTAISRTTGTALDLGMTGTSLTPENDTCMAVYNSGGAVHATSFNTGPGALPQISFGQGIRNPDGLPTDADPGLPFDGANPGRSPVAAGGNYRPDLLANNTYYVAVCNGDDGVIFQAGLFAINPTTETNVGTYNVNFRSWLTTNTAPFDVPPATDLGTVGGPIMTTAATLTDNLRYKWFTFTLTEGANDTTGKYLDIDTVPTPAPMNDTNIAVYDSAGGLIGLNDDINTWTAANPLGGNSALSFGSATPSRDYSAISADLEAYPGDGSDGYLAAGTYYIQVSMCCATYSNNRFWAINDYVTNLGAGDIVLNLRNNYDALPTQCSPADVGVQGGGPGQDNLLNNNDFIAFIDLFFASAPAADLGSQGGVQGADGQWNNNDFIVFIDYFFNDTALCTG
ncbi:MAG: GC-type dockerin domain-anchored protein [Phycisphaerales bacterium]|nr:GC-type dockerin domain-anchored protein [Phycisphaerales bacterium]